MIEARGLVSSRVLIQLIGARLMSRLNQQLKNQLGVGSQKTVELDSMRELQEQLDKLVQEIRISRQLTILVCY